MAFSAGSRLNAVPLPACTLLTWPGNVLPNASIFDVDGLPDPHQRELRFLEIGGDPDIERHHHHDRLSGRGQRADRGGQFCDAPVDGGAQIGSRQIGGGAIALRLGLLELRLGADLLRVQDVDLPLGDHFCGVGRIQRRLLAGEIGRGLLRALDGAGAFLHQILVADVFVGGEFERGLRLRHLFGGLFDLGLLRGDLGIDVFRRRFVLLNQPVGLIERGLVIS